MPTPTDREAISDVANPLGLDGIEFIEYATTRPQALGQVLEMMGFKPIARHRSREVLLYRQGTMNVVINAHVGTERPRSVAPNETPAIAAVALRVRDAAAAYKRALDRGAWAVPTHVEVMELNIPAIHGVGASRIYFVDRYREFSIYDVDFVPIPTVERSPQALADMHWFGLVQYIGNDRMEDWTEFYRELFGFDVLPDDERFGILPKGRILRSPCRSFYLQLIEPDPSVVDVEGDESLARIGLGAPDVAAAARALRARGVEFVESSGAAHRIARRADQELARRADVRAGAQRTGCAMTQHSGFIDDFGMDTITLSGSLPDKLRAMRDAGFSQVMLKASDLVAHPEGVHDAVRAVQRSGLRVTGFQVLRDFEGLAGHLHDYKVDIAKSMLEMARAVGAPLLLACSSTSTHATQDVDALARDLRKLAMLAVPLGLKIAYEGLSWGRTINEFTTAWEVVSRADAPNLGLGIDSFHILAAKTPLDEIDTLDPDKIFLVQLADFMWHEVRSFEERIATARHFRVFPGEGVHSAQVAELVLRLDALGYRGDYSFEVFNDDYQQVPPATVAQRARRSAVWLGEEVLRRSVPLPGAMRLKGRAAPAAS